MLQLLSNIIYLMSAITISTLEENGNVYKCKTCKFL